VLADLRSQHQALLAVVHSPPEVLQALDRDLAAIERLGVAGAAAAPLLVPLLDRLGEGARDKVLAVLRKLGPAARSAVPALVRLVLTSTNGGDGPAALALSAIAPRHPAAVAAALVGRWTTDEAKVQGPRALLGTRPAEEWLRDPQVLAALRGFLAVNEDVREDVAKLLGRHRVTEAATVAALRRLLGDGMAQVRREAARALGQITVKDAAVLTALRRALTDRESDAVRAAALAAMQALGGGEVAVAELRGKLDDVDGAVREAAAEGLATLKAGDPATLGAIQARLADQASAVRTAAAAAIGAIRPRQREASEALRGRLALERTPEVRAALATALLTLGGGNATRRVRSRTPGRGPLYPVLHVGSADEGPWGAVLAWVRRGRRPQGAAARGKIRGGEVYRLYSLTGRHGTAVGSRLRPPGPGSVEDVVKLSRAPEGVDALGLAGTWDALPRAPRIENDPGRYLAQVRGFLRWKGFGREAVRVKRAVRIDLEGDGTEEVLLEIEVPRDKGELKWAADIPRYSVVVMLRARGAPGPRLVPLCEAASANWGQTTRAQTCEIAFVLDLDGDGVMDVVTKGSLWEGGHIEAHSLAGGGRAWVIFEVVNQV